MSLIHPHTSAIRVALAADAGGLTVLIPWTAFVLAPTRRGVGPWPLMIKLFPIGAILFAALFAIGALLDHDPVGPTAAAGALCGSFIGPCGAAAAWAKTSAAR